MINFSLKAIYGAPFVLSLLTIAGLLSALLGDGLWDGLSWILLAVPLFATGYYMLRSKER